MRAGAFLICAAIAAAGCAQREDMTLESGVHGAAPDTTGAARRAAANATRQPGQLPTVMGVPVQGRSGPDGRPFEVARRTPVPGPLARQFGNITLGLALRTRTPELTQYPCGSCHLGSGQPLSAQRIPDAHRNIEPVHPRETGATCGNCHARENVELLALQSSERVTIDHAYRLCAQCHNPQVNAWAGGAHGKRLDGWQGRRVVMTCASCHDPHNPELQPRTPFRAPIIERRRDRP
jgi:hypothetical protein